VLLRCVAIHFLRLCIRADFFMHSYARGPAE
jgi:hypothetical protein